MEKAFHRSAFRTVFAEKLEEEPMKIKSTIHRFAHWPITLSMLAAAVLIFVTGCETQKPGFGGNPTLPPKDSKDIVLREADVLKIIFPGTENLNTSQTIRRDGKITLPIIGEIVAIGKTPTELEKELVDKYSKELVSSKDISVTVQSASFPIFVNGAVGHPGKVMCDHPMTVLEAIMESGGFDYTRANMKSVKVIRTQNNQTKHYTLNLKGLVNSGAPVDTFYLQPSDIVYVPSKIVWF
jgi:polysaccharide export outer membrane protein